MLIIVLFCVLILHLCRGKSSVCMFFMKYRIILLIIILISPVSRFECVSGLSVYWPIIALGTRECGVAKLCRDPTVQSEFFLRGSLVMKILILIFFSKLRKVK